MTESETRVEKSGDERGVCANMFKVQLTSTDLKKLNTFVPEKFLRFSARFRSQILNV